MATFRLFANKSIGSGKSVITKGTFIQVCKNSTCKPTNAEILEAIVNQLGIEPNTQVHMGQFDYTMIK